MSVLEYIDSDILGPVYGNKLPELTLKSVDAICQELYFAIKANEKIFIYGDYDMDGFCAQKVWDEVLGSLYDVRPVHFMYNQRMHNLDPSVVEQAKNSGARIVIINDTGSSVADQEVIGLLRLNGHLPIVIDHHSWAGNYQIDTRSKLVFNSFEEREAFGGHEVSGAYAALLVANRLCEKYFRHSLSYNAMVYALTSMYSDVVDLSTPVGRALYNTVSTIRMPGPALFSAMNKWDYLLSRRFFSFIVAPKINACFRMESFGPLNKALTADDKYRMKSVAEDFANVHSEAVKLTSLFIPLFSRERFGSIVLCVHTATDETRSLHIRNFSGLIASAIANEEKAAAVVLIYDRGVYGGSYRDYYGRQLLSTFRLFTECDGHDAAFGLQVHQLSEFKRHLELLSRNVDTTARRDYNVLSSGLIADEGDIQCLALYNEYMNVQPRVLLMHRCRYVRTMMSTKYKKVYDIGLPCKVSSTVPLYDGVNALLEPTISRDVELRCLE